MTMARRLKKWLEESCRTFPRQRISGTPDLACSNAGAALKPTSPVTESFKTQP
jgi:hypothetical protein